MHIVKGTKNKAAAEKFVDFAVAKEQAACYVREALRWPSHQGCHVSDKAQQRLPWGKDGSVANLALINWTELNAQRQASPTCGTSEIARQ